MLSWARFGVAIVLIAPILIYAARYVVAHHSTDGLVSCLAVGFVDSGVSLVNDALTSPVQAVLYCFVLALLSRFAFGHRK